MNSSKSAALLRKLAGQVYQLFCRQEFEFGWLQCPCVPLPNKFLQRVKRTVWLCRPRLQYKAYMIVSPYRITNSKNQNGSKFKWYRLYWAWMGHNRKGKTLKQSSRYYIQGQQSEVLLTAACTLNFFRNQIVVNLWQLSDITADLTRCCILATLNNLLLETQWPTRIVHSGNLQETAVSVDAQKYHNKEQDYFHQVCRMRTYNVRLPFGFASLRHTKLWLPPDVFMEYVHKDHSIKSSILFLQNRSMQASIFSNGASKQDKLPNMCSVLC